MAINSYFIGGYQWLSVVILLMVIGDYCIISYYWLLYVILRLFMVILL
jgi:hypothetical protein